MVDNLENAGPQDRARINAHVDWKLECRARARDVSEEALARAVKAVGPAVSAVREYLRK